MSALSDRITAGEVKVPVGYIYDEALDDFRAMTLDELAQSGQIGLEPLKERLLAQASADLDQAMAVGIEWPAGSGVWYALDANTRGLASGIMTNIVAGVQPEPVPLVARGDRTGGFATRDEFLAFYGAALQEFLRLSQITGAKKDVIRAATTPQEAAAAYKKEMP